MRQAAADVVKGAGLGGAISRRIGEPRLLATAFAATTMAYLPSLTLPWTISGLVSRLDLSTTAAGSLVTIQLAVLSAVAIGIGLVVDRLPKRAAAMFGAAAGLAGSLAVLFGPPAVLVAGMILVGAGLGLCCAVGNALIGRASQPGRLSANLWFLLLIAQAIIWYAAPLVSARHGLQGVYAIIVIGTLILSPLLLAMPAAAAPQADEAGVVERRETARMDRPAFVLMAVCAIGFWLRDSATWSLAAQRGAALGVSDQQMSMTLLGCALLGFAGPAAASFMGDRLGRTRTLLFGLVALTLVMTAIAAARTPLLYRLGFLLWTAASTFAWTYVLEIAALLDRRGRIAAVCGGLMFAAAAVGPLIGGLLDARHGAALPVAIAALGLLTLLTAAPAALRMNAATSSDTGSAQP
jgi:MFS family permease